MNAYQWIKCLSVKEIAHACIEMFNHYHNRWDCVGNYAEYGAPRGFLRFWNLCLFVSDLLRALLFFGDINTD